ncbi:hypothetical protein C8Q78DRAFT_1155413 [Trametes maxima]|nr:hypothetical protein C8Q78DRAFT_1155413 [Trametes maxima]
MHNKFIVVPTSVFMDYYVPVVTEKRNENLSTILEGVPVVSGQETAMYAPIVNALNENNICPGFTFVSTHSRGDPSDTSKEAPDIGLYPKDHAPSPSKGPNGRTVGAATNWSFVELCIECKTGSDPFNDKEPDFVAKSDEGKKILGQILSYIELMFKRQHRTCIFLVLILGNKCRIIRFDRSGAVVTQAFRYKTEGGVLVEFLWRYARWDHSTRGHDTSATLILPDSELAKGMMARAGVDEYSEKSDKGSEKDEDSEKKDEKEDEKTDKKTDKKTDGKDGKKDGKKGEDSKEPGDYVLELFRDSLDTNWSWWKLRVDGEDGVRHFVVGKPNFIAPGVAGRGTRGFVALDEANLDGPFYYLKDAWRVSSRHIDKEGTTLRYLNEKGVHYVPTLECHGDVSEAQVTKTQDLWKDLHEADEAEKKPEKTQAEEKELKPVGTAAEPEEGKTKPEDETEAEVKKTCPFKKHKHYRIVVREVGQKMSKFATSLDLVYALRCCIVAHSEAYNHGVIHRDISAGNVLMYPHKTWKGEWCGLLNDWELSKRTDSNTPQGRQLDRTGTWQFLSASALDHPSKEITIEDELESFLHVLLFFAIRFLHHNCVGVGSFMYEYFDDYKVWDGTYKCGRTKQASMKEGAISLLSGGGNGVAGTTLTFYWPKLKPGSNNAHPLNHIFRTILRWIASHYVLMDLQAAQPSPSDSDPEDEGTVATKGRFLDFVDDTGGSRGRASNQVIVSDDLALKQHEANALNLRSHAPILDLLKNTLADPKYKWPTVEKKADQLPEGGHKPNADPEAASANLRKGGSMHGGAPGAGSSLKRGSEHIEVPASQEAPKRAKLTKHDFGDETCAHS